MMRSIYSLLFGAAIGLSGTLLHNSYHPIGIFISFIAIWWAARLVISMYSSRSALFLFISGWGLVILRASSLGNGGEILIQGNVYGNLFAFGGLTLLALSVVRFPRHRQSY